MHLKYSTYVEFWSLKKLKKNICVMRKKKKPDSDSANFKHYSSRPLFISRMFLQANVLRLFQDNVHFKLYFRERLR